MTAVKPFSVPKSGDLFVDTVLERCEDLMESGIWDDFKLVRLETWMQNFHTQTEKYFAASVLDALIYRSERQTVALMKQIFQRVIPDQFRIANVSSAIPRDWMECLSSKIADPGVRLVPVIKNSDPPTKSGPLIARLYKREFGLNEDWMCWPWQIKEVVASGVRALLFVHDFLGSGKQFTDFCSQFEIAQYAESMQLIYAPLVAHEIGLGKVAQTIPTVLVCPAETLDGTYSLFSDNSRFFKDGENSAESISAFYNDLLSRNHFPMGIQARHGFGSLCVAYSFSHATPNNCTPILWRSTRNWNPLFDR